MDTPELKPVWTDADPAVELLSLYQTKVRDFADYDLSHADLQATCFSYANFRRSNLRHVNWQRANLRGIDLSDTNLSRSNFENADLRGAALDNSMLFMGSLNGADLRGADLSDASLDLTTLVGTNLQGANLRGTYLRGIELNEVALDGAYFDERTQFDTDFDPWSKGMRQDITLTIVDVLVCLNQIAQSAIRYLGQSAVMECWERSRFDNRYLAPFVLNELGLFRYSAAAPDAITFTHLKWLQLWINKFVRHFALESLEFPYVLDPNQLLVLNYQPTQAAQNQSDYALFGADPLALHATPAQSQQVFAAGEEVDGTAVASPVDVPAVESLVKIFNPAVGLKPTETTELPDPITRPKYNHYRFDDFFSLEPSAGKICDWYNARQIFAGEEFVLSLIQGLEQEVGRAAATLMYDLGKAWGQKDFAAFQQRFEAEFMKGIAEMPLAFVLEAWWWPCTSQGWGTWEVNLDTQENGFFFINIFDSAVARTLGDVGKPVCHLYAGLFAGFFSQLVQQDLSCIELKCYAMGDSYCQFLLGKQQQIDAATFWQTEGAAVRDIRSRLMDGEYLT